MRKSLIISMFVLLTLYFSSIAQAAPQVILNGQTLSFDVPPTIENGRTLVPLRAIFEALGADVQWDGSTKTVTATKAGTEIKLVIGGHAYINGQVVNLDIPAKIINDRTVVPLRFVSEALGCQVDWEDSTQTITITGTSESGTIKVHFIDVGQADSIYIQLPQNNDILIDAGNEPDGPTVVNYLRNMGVDDIELMIATHPHEDHIGGLPAVLDAFVVEKILDSNKVATTNIYELFIAKSVAEGSEWITDNRQSFTFGNSTLEILTGADVWDDDNDYSVVCRLDTGDIEFLFAGDAEGPAEAALTGDLSAEILKVGYHGSTSSASAAFLDQVNPQVAVISVGAGNTYGHPAFETLERIIASGAKFFRTDLCGDIVVTTDGYDYSVSTSRVCDTSGAIVDISSSTQTETSDSYVGSVISVKYHYPSCRYVQSIKPDNMIWFSGKAEAQAAGYVPCGVCKP